MYGTSSKGREYIKITSKQRNIMDNLGNTEWQNILDNLRQSKNELYSLSKGSGGIPKNNEQQGTPQNREIHTGKLNQDFCIMCGRDISDTGVQVCVQYRKEIYNMAPM